MRRRIWQRQRMAGLLFAALYVCSCGGGRPEEQPTNSVEASLNEVNEDQTAEGGDTDVEDAPLAPSRPGESTATAGVPAGSGSEKASRPPSGDTPNTTKITIEDIAPPSRPAGMWCPVLNDHVSRSSCDRAVEFAKNLGVGEAGIDAPKTMDVGEERVVSLAVTPPPDTLPPGAQNVAQVLGNEAAMASPVRTSRRMAAVLEGEGFVVSPANRVQRDLGINGGTTWRWKVQALPSSRHELHVSLYAVMLDDADRPTDTLIRVMHNTVEVKTDWLAQLKSGIAESTGVTSGLAQLATALAGLVAAVWGIWIALAKFRKTPVAGSVDDS